MTKVNLKVQKPKIENAKEVWIYKSDTVGAIIKERGHGSNFSFEITLKSTLGGGGPIVVGCGTSESYPVAAADVITCAAMANASITTKLADMAKAARLEVTRAESTEIEDKNGEKEEDNCVKPETDQSEQLSEQDGGSCK